ASRAPTSTLSYTTLFRSVRYLRPADSKKRSPIRRRRVLDFYKRSECLEQYQRKDGYAIHLRPMTQVMIPSMHRMRPGLFASWKNRMPTTAPTVVPIPVQTASATDN